MVEAVTDEQARRPEEQAAMTTGESDGPALVLGPMLRYVSETEATIWVETDRECRVEVLGRRRPDLRGGRAPLRPRRAGRPRRRAASTSTRSRSTVPSAGRSLTAASRRACCGPSARTGRSGWRSAPAGWRRSRRENLGRPARRERAGQAVTRAPTRSRPAPLLSGLPRDRWPDVLLMIGDQVYADEPGPATRQFIAERRDRRRPSPAPAGCRRQSATGRRLRGVLRPVPGGLERPRGSLALLRRPDRDDLRRPRRPR